MGIKDFSKTFKYNRIVKWSDLNGKTIAVDAMTEIYRASLGAKSTKLLTDNNGNPTIHISVILSNIIEMQNNNINAIWVFDFDQNSSENKEFHNPSKLVELKARREKREKAHVEIDELEKKEVLFSDSEEEEDYKNNKQNKINKLEKRTFRITQEQINEIKLILNILHIKYLESPKGFEGEHIAAYLSSNNIVDGVYSGDTDPIPFGAKVLYRKNTRDKKIYEYKQEDILEQIVESNNTINNPTILDIQKICSILGSDFSKRTKGVGPKTVLKKINTIDLADDQKLAMIEFSKKPNIEEIKINNEEKKQFTNCDIDSLLDWLVNEKSFTRQRVQKWFDKIVEKDADGNYKPKVISKIIKTRKKKGYL